MRKLIASIVLVVVLVLGLTVGIQLFSENNPDGIIARIVNPVIPCACITADEEV